MRDFKYNWLNSGIPLGAVESAGLTNDYLRSPFHTFRTAMIRTDVLASMPMMVAWFVRRDQQFTSNARYRITGNGDFTLKEISEYELTPEVEMELRKQLEEVNKLSPTEEAALRNQLGAQYIVASLATSLGMQMSMDAIYASIILQSWTAFESFASDLWAITIDKGPRHLANALAYSNELKKTDESITTKVLYDLEFDARTQLGSFLRKIGRASFQSMTAIKATYSAVFGKSVEQEFQKTNNGYIYALAAVRNVLAHKSGRADRQFTTQVQLFGEFSTIKKGDTLLLDGELVNKLRNAAVQMALALTKFVDNYISALPV